MKTKSRARVRALTSSWWFRAAGFAALLAAAPAARAQTKNQLDSLVHRAIAVNSTVRAAEAAVSAASARIGPAGAWTDPMLMLGVLNVMVGGRGEAAHGAEIAPDQMRMNMVGIGQTVPFPGKLSLARRAAEARLGEAEAELARVRLDVAAAVRQAYYDVALSGKVLDVVARNAVVLASLIAASEARYAAAGGSQVEALNARLEATRLSETAADQAETRVAALARLNALLERPSDTPLDAGFPPTLIAIAAPASSARASFVSTSLGARAAGSPLKTVAELQRLARSSSPALLRRRAVVEAERALAELAAREYLPDVTASLEYGQRAGLPDMVSARVSIPLPLFKRRKQDALAAAARADVAAAEAEVAAAEQALFAAIAGLHSGIERQRTLLALYVGALIPQTQATVQASLAGFQAGRTSLFEVLDHQSALFRSETEYFGALASFARDMAELEKMVGAEVLR